MNKSVASLALLVAVLLTACDEEGSTSSAPPQSTPCQGYACHWVGVTHGTATDMSGRPLTTHDTLHLHLRRDSTYRQWRFESAYLGSEQVGLKPFLPDSGTWSVAGSVLTIRRPARRDTVTFETELSGATLILKRASGDLVMSAQ